MSLKDLKDTTYFDLNNQLNIPKNNRIQLEKDKEALDAFFKENVDPNTIKFDSVKERMDYMIDNDFYDKATIKQYSIKFIEKLYDFLEGHNFQFHSFMAAYKFYAQYATKTNDGAFYLENYYDRVVINALFFADGNEQLALDLADEMVHQRYQPATPSFLNAGKARAGELVSCFTGDTLVTTSTGVVAIKDIQKGDKVLTHEGSYQKVLSLMERSSDEGLVELTILGEPKTLKATPEHPVLIYRPLKEQAKNPLKIVKHGDGETKNLKWVSIKDVAKTDYIALTYSKGYLQDTTLSVIDYVTSENVRVENDTIYMLTVDKKNNKRKGTDISATTISIKNTVPLNAEFGRFIGYFLAEGHIQKSQGKLKGVQFTLNEKDTYIREDLTAICKNLFGFEPHVYSEHDGSVHYAMNSKVLAEFMSSLTGSGFDKKILPEIIFEQINKDFIKGIIIGIDRGYATTTVNGNALELSNYALVQQIRDLQLRLGVTGYFHETTSGSGARNGRLNTPCSEPDNLSLVEEIGKDLQKLQRKQNYADNFSRWIDGYPVLRVKKTDTIDNDSLVYNLEVENNHTYAIGNVIVHNCFVVQPGDTMSSIGRLINSALQLSRIGGGVGMNLSNLREAGAPIKGIENAAAGVVPVMKLMEDSFSYANQLGQRQGAGVTYLNVFHPDIMNFLATKKENADEKIRVKTLSLGLMVPDKFYELIKKNEVMYTFSPYDLERVYGKPFNYIDITKEYDNMVANPKIKKYKFNARDIENEISKLQQESGYPYIINIDTVNNTSPISGIVVSSNLCSEVLEAQKLPVLNEDQTYASVGSDVSCNLGSINIANFMDADNAEKSIEVMVRALTRVSDGTSIEAVPSVKAGNEEAHAIGLGAMGLHGYLAKNHIMYGSEEAIDFVNQFFMTVNYYSLKASNKLAEERKQAFVGFEDSGYADGSYFDKYISDVEGKFTMKTDKVKSIFEGFGVPTEKDWQELKESVMKYGVYNMYRHCVAPTGSISYINDATSSLHPIVKRVEERQEKKIGKIYYPAPYLADDTIPYYESAYDMDMRQVIDTYATAQQHIDQGMSLTLFMRATLPEGLYEWKEGHTNKMTTRDLNILRNYAFKAGVKSIYYVRTFTDDDNEAGIDECVSCSI